MLSLVIAALAIVSMSMMACASTDPEALARPNPDIPSSSSTVATPRMGEQLFASTCAACHGANGEGAEDWMVREEDGRLPPPPLNGEGHTWHHSDGVLYRIVSEGGTGIGFGSNMPSFKDQLTRVEIIAVLEYVKTLWEGKEINGFSIIESQRELSETDPYPPSDG